MDLASRQQRVDDCADVVDDGITVERDRTGLRVDLAWVSGPSPRRKTTSRKRRFWPFARPRWNRDHIPEAAQPRWADARVYDQSARGRFNSVRQFVESGFA